MGDVVVTKKALIVVRSYPSPAKKGVEVSCTAAITDSGDWLRLFPVPYRLLPTDKRFRKYQWVNVDVSKASDSRAESYKIIKEGISILTEPLSSDNEWRERKAIVMKKAEHCLCCIKAKLEDGGPTLGIFKPKIKGLEIKAEKSATWSPDQLAVLRQTHLFEKGPERELEKIPYKFSYEFSCDHDECTGHKLKCVDWEMSELWRKCRDKYGDGWEAKFRERFETEMRDKYDTYFFVGTLRAHPKNWIVVGLFYPPNAKESSQATLSFT